MMKSSVIVRLIRLYGIVQGVGFRPFVSRTAALYNITGDVANKGSYVEIHAKGEKENFEKFLGVLKNDPPPRSMVLKVELLACAAFEKEDFAGGGGSGASYCCSLRILYK